MTWYMFVKADKKYFLFISKDIHKQYLKWPINDIRLNAM